MSSGEQIITSGEPHELLLMDDEKIKDLEDKDELETSPPLKLGTGWSITTSRGMTVMNSNPATNFKQE